MDRTAIATAYQNGTPQVPTATELRLFDTWLRKRFETLRPLTDFVLQEVDPEDFMAHWYDTGRLLISMANSEHPFWSLEQNMMFRAIHDADHLLTLRQFDWQGEVAAYRKACETAPERIHWILGSEILGQAAVAIETGAFPLQKLVRLS